MLRTLFRITILLILLAGSIAFYGWFEIGKGIDTANRHLPAGFSLSYDYHYMNHRGALVLTQPRLSYQPFGQIALANELIFTPNHWTDLLTLSNSITLGQYTENGRFEINRLKFNISALENVKDQGSGSRLIKMFARGCANKSDFAIADLFANKITEISGAFVLDYHFDLLDSRITWTTDFNSPQIGGFYTEFELRDMIPGGDRSPYISQGHWVFYDPKIFTVRDNYCAALSNTSVNEFKNIHIQSLTHFFQKEGVVLTDSFTKRYITFVENPENISLSLLPKTGIRINRLGGMTLPALIEELSLSVVINGRRSEHLVEVFKEPEIESVVDSSSSSLTPANPPISEKQKFLNPSNKILEQNIGKGVYVLLGNDQKYEGKILSVEESLFQLEVRTHGGYAILNLKTEGLKELTLQ